MITYGFFNSIDSDRVYNADQMSTYFKGLISNGVYENVGGKFQVYAGTGMNVNVQTGRAIIDCKWIESDAVETVPITAASAALNRWTAVVLRLDVANRKIVIGTVNGTASTTPSQPAMTNTSLIKEICLAMVYVAAGATAITQANIIDTRGTSLCGWVTGLIKQVDTSTLWVQWQNAFASYYAAMTAGFNEWFSSLTDELNVNTIIRELKQSEILDGVSTSVDIDAELYTGDIVNVYINGLYAKAGTDYTLVTVGSSSSITGLPAVNGTVIDIQILRSQIGFYIVEAAPDYGLGNDNEGIMS